MATPPLAIDETCATCGRLLFTSLLAGGKLLRLGKVWHHACCVHRDECVEPGGPPPEAGNEN
jgi:hypothetical protein